MDIEWVIYHLIHNDDDYTMVDLDIDFYDADVWYRLIVSLRRNTTLTDVRLTRGKTRVRRWLELQEMFTVLSNLPNIKGVVLIGFTAVDLEVGTSLLSHNKVTQVRLDLESGVLPLSALQALGSAPRLQRVNLEISESACLAALCQSPTLEELTVESQYGPVCLEEEHWVSLARVLCHNTTMKYFDMDLYLPDENLFRVADILKENTVLDEIRVACCGFEEKEDVVYFRKVVDALKANQTLSRFHNYGAKKVPVPSEIHEAQLDMLERNFQLVYLVLFKEDDDQTKKNMYLKLNAQSRKRLFQADAASKADWMDVLAMIRDDLDCLFYYLTINPALCKLNEPRSTDHYSSKPSPPPSQITLVKSGTCLTQKEHLKALRMAQQYGTSTTKRARLV
jgi:hypothetical protein